MKIAIEAQRIFRTNKHGMDFVALESIRELQNIDHENEYFIFVTPGEDRCLEESENVHIIELKCATYPLWEPVALPSGVTRILVALFSIRSSIEAILCPCWVSLAAKTMFFSASATAWQFKIFTSICLIGMSLLYNRFQ